MGISEKKFMKNEFLDECKQFSLNSTEYEESMVNGQLINFDGFGFQDRFSKSE